MAKQIVFLLIFAEYMLNSREQYINLHTHHPIKKNYIGIKSFCVHEICNDTIFPKYFSAGIHPWNILKADLKSSYELLESLTKNNLLLAIGECGLDRSISVDINEQIEVFLTQLEIAKMSNKPLIVHNVRAFSDFLQILKSRKLDIPIIFHGFNGNEVILNELLNYNTYF